MRRFIPRIVVSISIVAATIVFTQSAQAQKFTVLHNFTGGEDGAYPYAGLAVDRAGNFYGTTLFGGYTGGNCNGLVKGCGTVFKLSYKGAGWIFTPLYSFQGYSDGNNPQAGVTIGPNGNLYGTTFSGGNINNFGTVYNLRPSAMACKSALCPWTETVLYRFTCGSDGANPDSDVIFDQAGNMYGITANGGSANSGTVYELMPSNGGWRESVLYTFTGGNDGASPEAGLIFDGSGNLYGTTSAGGDYGSLCSEYNGCGVVFELTPSQGSWTETTLHLFDPNNGDGYDPTTSLIFDQSGNIYGTTGLGGSSDRGGTVFELMPNSKGSWTETLLHSFTQIGDGGGPAGALTMDAAGNLYGTTNGNGAYGFGAVFKLTPSNGSWTYTSLHDFTGGSDGGLPVSNVIFDANGNLYGTAYGGGGYGYGFVWEITPP
jgi:uncharacterized repeat protein (TIGR03803 family)